MKIGILQTGRSPEEMRARHGDYDDLFKRMLAGRGFEFETYPVLDGVFPKDVHAAGGWLVTGSKHGAYEDHDWIPLLEAFLRDAYAAVVPIIGVCFGHQILAQALGGRVEKYKGGWSVGPADYGDDRIIAWHQDQVVELPEGAEVVGSSEFCPYAMLSYGDRAFTVQPHPEFSAGFLADLVAARGAILPDHIARGALERLGQELTSARYADLFDAFFRRDRSGTQRRDGTRG